METQGLDLLKAIIESTGLPAQSVEREIQRILNDKNLSAESLRLEDIREVLATYLQEVLVEAKGSISGL